MAKKFLDFTGLSKYDELIKDKIAKDIKVVQDDLDTRKVKDTQDSATITWTKGEDGVYTAAVAGDVVIDSKYGTVKTNANNSAAAWTKFLTGSSVEYPNGITPTLAELATKTYADGAASGALADAKTYADGLAVNYDAAGSAAQALTDAKAYADGLASNYDAAGSAAQALTDAKAYADGLASNYDAAGSAAQALTDAKAYVDDKVDGKFDAAGSAAQALTDAKAYADSLAVNYDAAGSAADALADAKDYTDAEVKKVSDRVDSINTAISGGVHFIGITSSEITDGGTQTPVIEDWVGPANKGDIVINGKSEEFIWDGSKWHKLGDTTAELQAISALEDKVDVLMGDDTTAGSVAKALKDAKDYTDSEITALTTGEGAVAKNTAAIATLNGDENTTGSVAKALKDAKDYADSVGADANDYTDDEIAKLVAADGQVGINTAAIATLNGNAETAGSVDYKIAQAVANIEDSIESIPEADITGLFA